PDPMSQMMAERDTTRSGLTTTTIPVRREGVGIQPVAAANAAAGPSSPAAGASRSMAAPTQSTVAMTQPATMAQPAADQPEPRKPLRLGVTPVSAELPIE